MVSSGPFPPDGIDVNSVVFSHLLEDLKSVKCQKKVLKKLPHCEHSKQVACHKDPASVLCANLCGQLGVTGNSRE